MNRKDVLSNARYAGGVIRYHAWQVLQRQSVGEHTWQCLRIWFQIWGAPSSTVTTYFIWHDAGELVTGDIPFPVKMLDKRLKEIMDEKETDAVLDMGGELVELMPEDCVRVKICDLIEMHEFGIQELRLGNEFGQPIIDDTYNAICDKMQQLDANDQKLVYSYLMNHTWYKQQWRNHDDRHHRD